MENRVKQYLLATVTVSAGASSEEVTERLRETVYEAVAPNEGQVADVWDICARPDCTRTGSVTVYWKHDPIDDDPNPPHLIETGAWLRNIAPTVKKALGDYQNIEVSFVTERRTVERLLIL